MSVIAWDGETLAADSCAAFGEVYFTTDKIFKLRAVAGFGKRDVLIGIAGEYGCGLMIKRWMEETDMDVSSFPNVFKDWGSVVCIVPKTFRKYDVVTFENYPVPSAFNEKEFATGIGKELAIGAMMAGASAIRAVEIACQRIAYCTLPVKSLTF